MLKAYILMKGADITVLQLANMLAPGLGIALPVLKEIMEMMMIAPSE